MRKAGKLDTKKDNILWPSTIWYRSAVLEAFVSRRAEMKERERRKQRGKERGRKTERHRESKTDRVPFALREASGEVFALWSPAIRYRLSSFLPPSL